MSMAELIVVVLAILFLWALLRMFRCPRCKTLKSVFSKKRKKIDLVEDKAKLEDDLLFLVGLKKPGAGIEMHCSACGHIWKHPLHHQIH